MLTNITRSCSGSATPELAHNRDDVSPCHVDGWHHSCALRDYRCGAGCALRGHSHREVCFAHRPNAVDPVKRWTGCRGCRGHAPERAGSSLRAEAGGTHAIECCVEYGCPACAARPACAVGCVCVWLPPGAVVGCVTPPPTPVTASLASDG